jgi:tetratricopeptide (TPR) repeat protein/tRNA A-37 threonylcarbamoyl transferase component Bud32
VPNDTREGEPTNDPTVAGKLSAGDRAGLPRGSCIGRYLVVDLLGEGGMGVVYKAYDPDLDRPVAIKLLNAGDRRAEELRDRLLREAQAMAKLSHPNVISVFDVGTFRADVFVAMELVEGATLRKWLQSHPRSRREILDAFLAAGEGLAAAHRAGLVHRDFKPDNVMVGDDGRVRVLDFGLARTTDANANANVSESVNVSENVSASVSVNESVNESASGSHRLLDTPLTHAGMIVGTPRFMPPEQHRGAVADERADQFAFCVSLYEALHGVHPFHADAKHEMLDNLMAGRIGEPPQGASVPRWLRRAIVRGLGPRPADRYPSMSVLLDALRADPAITRRRWLAAAAMVALSAAALVGIRAGRSDRSQVCRGAEGLLAGVWDPSRRGAAERAFLATGLPYAQASFESARSVLDGWTAAWARMHVQSCEATRLRGDQSEELLDLRTHCLNKRLDELRAVTDLFVGADAALVQRSLTAVGALGAIEECADVAALRLRVRRPTAPAARAELERLDKEVARVGAATAAGRYTEADKLSAPLLAPVRAIGYRPLEAELLGLRGHILSHFDLRAALETELDAALAAEAARDDSHAALEWAFLVFLNGQQGSFAEAHRCARVARAQLERAGNPPAVEATLLNTYGDMLDDEGKWDEAVANLRRGVELRVKLGEPGVRDLALSLNDLGVALLHQGRVEDALAAEERALAVWQKLYGASHPFVAMSLNNSAEDLLDLGRHDEAASAAARALAIDEQALGPDAVDLNMDLLTLAGVQLGQKRFAEALRTAQRALVINSRSPGANGENLAESLHRIGCAQLGLGRASEAIATLKRAVASDGLKGRYGARARFDLARALWETGERTQARALASEARRDAAAAVASGGVEPQLREMDQWLAAHAAR